MAKEIINKEQEEEKEINTILAEDIEFNGTLRFSSSLKIKGVFSGEIDSSGHLYIGKSANVKAKIKAKYVSIYGKMEGNIEAAEKVDLFSTAELTGDVKAPDLLIQSGSKFNGKCIMSPKEQHKPASETEGLNKPAAKEDKKRS